MGLGHSCKTPLLQYSARKIFARGKLTTADHCLEVLRRSVLCQPDLTLQAIHWQDEEKTGMDLEPQSPRECVDFSAIDEFSATRMFSRDMIADL